MKFITPLDQVKTEELSLAGGKAGSLYRLLKQGISIPESYIVTSNAYEEFINENHLSGLIQLELNRKDLNNCRWEELWDISLRIKNAFLKASLNKNFINELEELYNSRLRNSYLAARSSSTVEDSLENSFAGLHESFLGINSLEQLANKIKLVWASLWSDASLSYRKELQLNINDSSMAVLLQKLIDGKSSGIAFSRHPSEPENSVIEAAYGINQAVVDGSVEPERWIISRAKEEIIKRTSSQRNKKMVIGKNGLELVNTDRSEQEQPPLSNKEAIKVYQLSRKAESFYQTPQDVEWTIKENRITLLQSRPITVKKKIDPKTNRRDWDLSLKRSFNNLLDLQSKIKVYLQNMADEAKKLKNRNLKLLSDKELTEKYNCASRALDYWTDIYWETFIPYGHGMRLFGQVYNEVICPEDPYEFITLLQKDANLATRRNNELQKLSQLILSNKKNPELIKKNELNKLPSQVKAQIRKIVDDFAMPSILLNLDNNDNYTRKFFDFIVGRFAQYKDRDSKSTKDIKKLEKQFIEKFPEGEKRIWACDLLELGRHSFLMRDDDNVFLNRFKDIKSSILDEIKHRLARKHNKDFKDYTEKQLLQKFENPEFQPPEKALASCRNLKKRNAYRTRKRQVTGQPACPGYISGTARLIKNADDLFNLKEGEILVCDSIGPEMTFAVPLAGGIIERRGGMLIHGAIIAREYGIPCVTGVADATSIIKTGDKVWIDGYLGIASILLQPEK
ncbi:MAG: PEP/pyruvate-binding domain-containing protein [Candidatus Rifleibacteriota bacterium]